MPTVTERDRLLTTAQVAELLTIREQTLALWRSTGQHGLPFIRCGRAVRYRLEKRRRRCHAYAVPDRQLRISDAVELGAVVVVVERNPRLLRGGDHRPDQRVGLVAGHHPERSPDAVEVRLAPVEILRPLEDRQHIRERPARAATIAPVRSRSAP